MWRDSALLPDAEPITLGEGFTPIMPSRGAPRVLVKDEGLNPAFHAGQSASEPWKDAATLAAGLRVPKAYGDTLVLDILRRSGIGRYGGRRRCDMSRGVTHATSGRSTVTRRRSRCPVPCRFSQLASQVHVWPVA